MAVGSDVGFDEAITGVSVDEVPDLDEGEGEEMEPMGGEGEVNECLERGGGEGPAGGGSEQVGEGLLDDGGGCGGAGAGFRRRARSMEEMAASDMSGEDIEEFWREEKWRFRHEG